MKRLICAASCCVILVVLAGCDTTDVATIEEPETLLPLAVGNQWIMQMTGEISGRPRARIDTFAVVRDSLIEGERWYRIEGAARGDASICEGWYTNREDGLWRLYNPPDRPSSQELAYPFPAAVGTTHVRREGDTVQLVEKDVPYQTPGGGIVPSHHYRRTLTKMFILGQPHDLTAPALHDNYLAPGAGFVRLEQAWLRYTPEHDFEQIGREVWELLSFTPASQ